ncbi:hypothetical protein MUO14_11130 [Halobacillus shinanisalinarum]|uniref:ABC transporter permease n=1 Tax=Halobacillus shinanisalinarum TaxID=2932258 RepID=A0ABY4H4N9_9BACI|nr:hypothetical protein [Halobacillus shinanisalinarum]UOQ95426.1 hypothetical protein MUO14_11130 [Halobacillus shinanisalinarum]
MTFMNSIGDNRNEFFLMGCVQMGTRERSRKKRNLYKQALILNFDWTIVFYLAVYVVIMLFIIYEWLQDFLPLIETWQVTIADWLWVLPIILLLRACGQSFFHPGLSFTSSELKISMLPHSRKRILWYVVAERVLVHTCIAFVSATLIGIVTPFSLFFSLNVAFIYSLFFLLTVIIHWKMYSLPRWRKLLIIFFIAAFSSGTRYGFLIFQEGLPEWAIGICLFLILAGMNVYLIPKVLQQVNWGKVVATNDAKVWNIKLISQITKINIKPPKRYGILQTYLRSRRAQQRFTNIHSLYHRLWRNHLQAQFNYVGITVLSCVVVLGVLPGQVEWILIITAPIALFIYIEVSLSLFEDQFRQQPILSVLPIEEKGWQSTYYKWALAGISPLFLTFVFTVWAIDGMGIGLLIQIIGFVYLAVYELHRQIFERMHQIQRRNVSKNEFLQIISYLLLGLGLFFPPTMIAIILIPWIEKYTKQKLLTQRTSS